MYITLLFPTKVAYKTQDTKLKGRNGPEKQQNNAIMA